MQKVTLRVTLLSAINLSSVIDSDDINTDGINGKTRFLQRSLAIYIIYWSHIQCKYYIQV